MGEYWANYNIIVHLKSLVIQKTYCTYRRLFCLLQGVWVKFYGLEVFVVSRLSTSWCPYFWSVTYISFIYGGLSPTANNIIAAWPFCYNINIANFKVKCIFLFKYITILNIMNYTIALNSINIIYQKRRRWN